LCSVNGRHIAKGGATTIFCRHAARRVRPTTEIRAQEQAVDIDFKKADGLVPAIIQDHTTGNVLMLGFMNEAALKLTRETGEVTFFSRSRNKLWKKGESSGHVLRVRELLVDCDADAILVKVDAVGPGVCHEGYRSCFYRAVTPGGDLKINAERTFDPAEIYNSGAKT
jgi:phosphoribosyl-AMP cyclohydrolase